MPGRLHNKTAIITGSSSGIGRAISLAFASEGASLLCADLHPTPRAEYATDASPTSTTVQEAVALGARALFVKCDTTSSSEMQALVQKAVQEYGRLDIMVNNAGISVETGSHGTRPVWEYEEEAFERTLGVNVKGVFLGVKYAAGQMVRQEPGPGGDRGWIVNLASVYGLRAGENICELALVLLRGVTFGVFLYFSRERLFLSQLVLSLLLHPSKLPITH